MKDILKSMLLAPSAKRMHEYRGKFRSSIVGRDGAFDEVMEFLDEYHRDHELWPTPEVLVRQFEMENATHLADYVKGVLADPGIASYGEDSAFIQAMDVVRTTCIHHELQVGIQEFQTSLATPKTRGIDGVVEAADQLSMRVAQAKQKIASGADSVSSLLYRSEEMGKGTSLREIYARICDKKDTEGALYYDIGLPHFGNMKLKPGDLTIIGGYTSHGKSILTRWIAYYLLVYYGLNVAFISREMTHEAVRVLFALLHANNKDIFPSTPYIDYEAWKTGKLTEEEVDFLFNRADYDLRNNEAYGILYIDQPNKTRYRLSDLNAKIVELETTTMPVHVVAVDYLTLMYPREGDKGTPDVSDYNDMIKSFKTMALAHRNVHGEPSPFLGITPAQISRGGLANAIKAEGLYDPTALNQYTELEKSADQLLTVYMTPEMRASNRFRVQHLKNRDGEVVHEPLDAFVDLKRGFGLSEVQAQTASDLTDTLRTMNI
jgi:hypothetical protein